MIELHKTWSRGQKAELARRCEITTAYVTDIFKKRKTPSPELAKKISEEAWKMGLKIDRLDLLYPRETENPLFSGEDNVENSEIS